MDTFVGVDNARQKVFFVVLTENGMTSSGYVFIEAQDFKEAIDKAYNLFHGHYGNPTSVDCEKKEVRYGAELYAAMDVNTEITIHY